MSDTILTDSNVSATQEVQETAPVESENAESQNNTSSAWDESYDVNDGEVTQESETTDEPNDEPTNNNEYITKGLGKLDKPLVVKVKGDIYDLTDMDQIRDLVEKGFIATQKLQEVAAMKRELEKQANPDLTDSDFEKQDVNDEIESISQEILNSDYAEDVQGIIGSMPKSDVQDFSNNPDMLRGLKEDVQSGFAQAIMPNAKKYMNIDGMSFIEAYVRAGKEHLNNSESQSNKAEQTKTNMELLASGGSGSSAVMESKPTDIWDMSDEQYRNLTGTIRQ